MSVAEGVLWLTSLAIDEQLALGGDIVPGHDVLSGRYACYGTYATSDGKWLAVGAIEAKFFANLCAALGCPELAVVAARRRRRSRGSGRHSRPPSPTRTRDEWVEALAGADTCVAPVLEISEVAGYPQFVARGVVGAATHPTEGELSQLAPLLAGMERPESDGAGGAARHDADGYGASLEGGRCGRRDGGPLGGAAGRGMTGDALAEARDLIGKEQYHEVGEFPVERGYVWTSCASVENGNPLYWDDEVASALTGGPVAPPSMVSVWFRPHHWAPGRTEEALPLQVHFDLKERFGLPEAVMTDNTIEFHTPVRMGDVLRTHQVLRSVSDEKTTKLGTGRFWVIDVVYSNQDGELVAIESYTGFGYRREAAS